MKNLYNTLKTIYNNEDLRRTIVPLFCSTPGLGKTTIIKQFAKDHNARLVEIITSQINPTEVSGMAIPDKTREKMTYYDFDRLLDLKDGDILFFDELLDGNEYVLSACLTLLQNRTTISGKPLPDIMIVAAANPDNSLYLKPAIKERFYFIKCEFNTSMYCAYLRDKYGIPLDKGGILSNLVTDEIFSNTQWNYYTPRTIDKEINMLIHGLNISSGVSNVLTHPLLKKIPEHPEVNTVLDLVKLYYHANNKK